MPNRIKRRINSKEEETSKLKSPYWLNTLVFVRNVINPQLGILLYRVTKLTQKINRLILYLMFSSAYMYNCSVILVS